ncbi:hypothetical protein BGZ63DRAFT_406383 [Mariannaea sp. PMI_226]|nr:hypothetical protein BGZ63DRAFT_406383 [Mariannaea sp. PMI_226]
MKFSNVLFFATVALAAPAVVDRENKPTPVNTVIDAANQFNTAVEKSINSINTILQGVGNNAGATISVKVEGDLKANLGAITKEVTTATTTLLGGLKSLVSVAVGSVGSVTKLPKGDLDALTKALAATLKTIASIQGLVTKLTKGVPPAVQKLVKSEVGALTKVLGPFVGPLNTFITTIVGLLKTAGVSNNLGDVVKNASDLLKSLVSSLGITLPSLPIPLPLSLPL